MITAQILQSTGPSSAGGAVLGTQTIAAPANWTRLTGLDGTIPQGGAILKISSNAEAFRYAKMDPISAQDAAAGDRPPPHSGELVPSWGAGSENTDYVAFGTQIWVKQQ